MADSSWYVLYVRPLTKEGKPVKMSFPLVGKRVIHFLGRSEDDAQLQEDKKSPLWDKIQDDNRPSWAPDLLRLGYAIVFKREGLPKLALRLGITDPKKLKTEGPQNGRRGHRVLTFDDVWVVGVSPYNQPFVMPNTNAQPGEWWSRTRDKGSVDAPWIAPGGGQIVVGAQRLSDVVRSIFSTPEGYPRAMPGLEDEESQALVQLVNPMLPRLPVVRVEPVRPTSGPLEYYSGIELFRF